MGKYLQAAKSLARDEEGAALIEYTVLLGILVVAVITTIIAVGGWANAVWGALCDSISGKLGGGACVKGT